MGMFDHSDASVWLLALGLCIGRSLGEAALLEEVSVLRAGWIHPKVLEETLLCLLIPAC